MPTEQEIADAKAKADAEAAEAKAKADAEAAKGSGEETITVKKSDYEKLESDRDNYRTAALKKKADERSLDGKGDQDDDDPNVINEKKVNEFATSAARKVQREASEKSAKRAFLSAHPEYADDGEWTGLLENLTFKGDETTVDEVQDRMEAALFEHKRKTGKLEEHLKAERERGVQEGRIRSGMEMGHSSGGPGDRNVVPPGGTLSPKAQEMAQRMHVDPEKLKKIDIKKDNVIQM